MGTPEISHFGIASTGEAVQKIVLKNDILSVSLLTWGAIVQDVRLTGIDRSLTLGSDSLSDYEGDMRHHGSIIGPIANRISTARVTIDGLTYELERNQDGAIHLHSGADATHRRLWQLDEATDQSATLSVDLGDGTCGLPGNRHVTARFALDGPTLDLQISGTTDAKTLMNFANHSYWNFDGTERWDGHMLWVAANRFLPGTPQNYPTGEVVMTAGSDMDFNVLRSISVNDPPFDNNFCLSDSSVQIRDVLQLQGASGIGMRVATDQPGIQVYDGREAIRPGRAYYEGLAIEAQGWPDAPSHAHFPPITVTPDQPYRQHTRYTFGRFATK